MFNSKPLHIECPHFSACSGCTLNKHVELPPLLLEAQQYFQTKGIKSLGLHVDQPTGWRCRARVAVRGSSSEPSIGLFRAGSHDVLDIPHCRVHHPSINAAISIVRKFIQTNQISLYQEETHRGDLRYLQLTVDRLTKKVQLVFVLNNREVSTKWSQFLKQLWEVNVSSLHSIWINFNSRPTNTIFGPQWLHLHGEKYLWEQLVVNRENSRGNIQNSVDVCFLPAAFSQANLNTFEIMLTDLVRYVPNDSIVLDYYSGVGVIGLSILHKASKVICFEINPQSQECFEHSRARLTESEQEKITFKVGHADQFSDFVNESDVIIVDPPRKGLDRVLLNNLLNIKDKKTLIYVSCGWNSFKNDCDLLLKAGWQLADAKIYLFFPGSNHLEILAKFTNNI